MSAGQHHKDQLLEVLFHYLQSPMRQRLMVECPAAYNAYCGREIVKVVRTCDDVEMNPDRRPTVKERPWWTHPDWQARCGKCHFRAIEHDPLDHQCPDDDDHARANREEHIADPDEHAEASA